MRMSATTRVKIMKKVALWVAIVMCSSCTNFRKGMMDSQWYAHKKWFGMLFPTLSFVQAESEVGLKIERSVHEAEVQQAAYFVLEELRKLSDSGVYQSLNLLQITGAQSQHGVFHYNIYLNLTLASPHFKSGKTMEFYEVILMEHLEDKSKSFAINEFPDMNDDAVEEYWIQKVEDHRKKREALFSQWEEEIAFEQNQRNQSYVAMSSTQLRDLMRNGGGLSQSDKTIIQDILDARIDQLLQKEMTGSFITITQKDEL